jgi:hypothetical protein
MQITRTSPLSGTTRTLDLDVTQEQIDKWQAGAYIQDVMSHLSTEDREFIISGIIPEEWNMAFPDEDDDEEDDWNEEHVLEE